MNYTAAEQRDLKVMIKAYLNVTPPYLPLS